MVAAAALVVVGLAIDVTSVVYNSRQIHIHRRNQRESNDSSNMRKHHYMEDSAQSDTKFYYSASTEEMSYAKYVHISH